MMTNEQFWDVHTHTKAIKEVVDSGMLYRCVLDKLGRDFCHPPPQNMVRACFSYCQDMLHFYPQATEDDRRQILGCIQKFQARWDSKTWKDPELGNIDIAMLFVAAIGLCFVSDDKSIKKLFLETLKDIGDTCIQGDSHRLIHFIIGVCEPGGSKQKNS